MNIGAKEELVDHTPKEFHNIEDPLSVLLLNLEKLAPYGGFSLFESLISGASDINPTSKARRSIFSQTQQSRNLETVWTPLSVHWQMFWSHMKTLHLW